MTEELIRFLPGDAPFQVDDLPIVFACVVARHEGQVLFVFNPFRDEWELPAGLIERGETPEAAAHRELLEESGQVAGRMQFAGMALLRLQKHNTLELGAMFTCELETLQPFQPNDEADRMMLWDLVQPVPGRVSAVGRQLALLI